MRLSGEVGSPNMHAMLHIWEQQNLLRCSFQHSSSVVDALDKREREILLDQMKAKYLSF